MVLFGKKVSHETFPWEDDPIIEQGVTEPWENDPIVEESKPWENDTIIEVSPWANDSIIEAAETQVEPIEEEKPGLLKGLISGAKDIFGKVFPKLTGTPEQEAFEQQFSPTGVPIEIQEGAELALERLEPIPEPPPIIPGESRFTFPEEMESFTRGIVSNLPTTSVGLFTFPVRVLSGAGAALEGFVYSGEPGVALEEFKEGYEGNRGIFGHSAKWWDDLAEESKGIIRGKPSTKEEEYQHILADQVITAIWLTVGGYQVSKMVPGMQRQVSNVVNKAKGSLQKFRELELTADDLANVRATHQGVKGKTAEALTPRQREFYDVLLSESGGVKSHALKTGTYTTDELVYPWQKIKTKDIKVAKKPIAALKIPEGYEAKPPATVPKEKAVSDIILEKQLAKAGITPTPEVGDLPGPGKLPTEPGRISPRVRPKPPKLSEDAIQNIVTNSQKGVAGLEEAVIEINNFLPIDEKLSVETEPATLKAALDNKVGILRDKLKPVEAPEPERVPKIPSEVEPVKETGAPVPEVARKQPIAEEVDKLTEKEYIDKYGEPKPPTTPRKPIPKRGQYSELTREEVKQTYSDINKEFESAETARQTRESAIEGEIPATKFGSELRKTLQKEFSGNQWRNLIGSATRDSKGNLIKYSPDVQKRLDEIAEGWNTERIEGTLDPKDPLSRLLHSSKNVDKVWQANDVQDVIMGGKNVKDFEAFARDVEGKRAIYDEEYETVIDVLDKKMAELDSRAEELGIDLRPGAEEFDFGPTEEALFLTGKTETEAGAVTVPTPGKGLRQRIKTSPFVKKFKAWMLADKAIPNSIVRWRVRRTGRLVNFSREVESEITNLWDGMKESYGRKWNKLTDKEEYKLNQALANPSKIKNLPENLQGLIKHFRAKVDGLTKMMIDEGLATGELAVALKKGEGIYLHRQYRIHKDKKWRKRMINVREGDKIAYELRNRTKAFLYDEISENPKDLIKVFGGKTEKQIDAILEGKVDELLQIKDSPIQIFTGDTELSKEVMSIFKKRKNIPAEIRALWGEYKVLDFNYAQTVLKQAKMLENYRMFKNIRENNLGTFFHEGNPIVKDGVSYSKKIDAGNNPALKPLDGLYTTKEIYDEMLNMDKNTPLPWWARQWMKGVALTKIGKTVLQSMTHMRNSQSNLFITNSLGNLYNTKVPGVTVKATKEIYHLMINKSDAELDGFLKGAIERGVVGESVNVGILRDVVNDSRVETFDQFIGVRRGNLLRKVAKLPEKLYSAEDDTPKLFNYIMEIDTYKRAAEYDPKSIEKIFPETKFPDKSDPQFIEKVMDVAAEIIRSGMPTYSKIPKGIRELRRLPFRGSFVSFPYEMVRTTGNLIKLINKEMKSGNPVLQAKAAKRIVGLTTSTTLTSAVMGGAATAIYQGYKIAKEYLTGEEKKEGRKQFTEKEKKIIQKYMLPVWSRNADITLIEYKDGVYYYSDNSYTNPYAQQLNNPINAFMRGDDYKKGLLAATGEFFQPYMSEDIFTSLIVDLHRNKDQAGNEIWNESEDWDIQVVDALNHCMDKVEPGFIHAARRFYRALNEEKKGASGTVDDIDAEIMAQMTGVRISKCDPIVALKFAAYDFQKEKKNASRLSYRKDVATSYKLKKKIYDNFADQVNATVSLGFTKKKIYRALRGTGMTSGDILHIYAGTYDRLLGAKMKKAEATKGIKKKIWD